MLKISIVEGHHHPKSKNTKSGVRHHQDAYVHLGGAYPQQIEIPLNSAAEAFAIGDYQLNLNSFRVGKYKSLELNPFELNLLPFNKSVSKVA